ncbi:MAG TPA: hypothetical protein VGS13_12720, partial [Stellaceae bacterium]|nr:hypothetical protein [Stellaceae bacterium]
GGREKILAGGVESGAQLLGEQSEQDVYGTAIGVTVSNGGRQVLASGGAASNTVVGDPSFQIVSGGAAAFQTTLVGGGEQIVDGKAFGTVASQGGILEIESKGRSEAALLHALSVELISAGGIAIHTLIDSGGSEKILAGGVESGAQLLSQSEQDVFGTAVGVTVSNGGIEIVESGGTLELLAGDAVASFTISAGGKLDIGAGYALNQYDVARGVTEEILAGGTASATVVNSGATQVVDAGAVVGGTVVSGAGQQTLISGATVSGALIESGGSQVLSSGGAASNTVVGDPSFQIVSGGASAFQTTLVGGGEQIVDGNAFGTVASQGGVLEIESKGRSEAALLHALSVELISAGGIAIHTLIDSGGREKILAGGVESGAQLLSQSEQDVYGTAIGVTVSNGGIEIVESGGTLELLGGDAVASFTISTGGKLDIGAGYALNGYDVARGVTVKILAGGTTSATVIHSGGSQIVSAGGTAGGTTISKGGTEIVHGKASGGTIDGGLLEVTRGGTASGTVTFVSGGTLQLDAGASFTGAIKGFGKPALSDRIDLRGIAFTPGATTKRFVPTTTTSGTLTVSGGGHNVHLTLLGAYTTSSFKQASDGHGGTLVTDPPVAGGGAPQTTFADIAPAGPPAGAAIPIGLPSYMPGAIASHEQAHAGQTLLATGRPGGPAGGDHNPLLAVR